MNDLQASIRLRASQWERILDLTMIGVKVYERFMDVDPELLEQDTRVYETLRNALIARGVIEDDLSGPKTIINVNVSIEGDAA